jgi:hypothetical protein
MSHPIELHYIGGPNDGVRQTIEMSRHMQQARHLLVPELIDMTDATPPRSMECDVRVHPYWLMPLGTKLSGREVWAAVSDSIRP